MIRLSLKIWKYTDTMEYFLKKMKNSRKMDGIELQVNARNAAAYEMYRKYGFTEKSINMELLGNE